LPVVDEEDKWKPVAIFKEAVRSLLNMGTGIVNGLIWGGVFLPALVVLVLIVLGIRWGIRRHRKNRK
jgi:hypothetical protein